MCKDNKKKQDINSKKWFFLYVNKTLKIKTNCSAHPKIVVNIFNYEGRH